MSRSSRRASTPLAAALSLAALAGCPAVGPDFERPAAHVGRSMPEAASVDSSRGVRFTEDEPWERWWEVFHDPEIERLVVAAREANLDLRAAYARVATARSVVRESFGSLLPTIGAIGAYQYVKLPPINPSGGQGPASGPFSGQPFQALAGLGSLSYEIDFWGRVRRLLEGSNADEVATEEDRKVVELQVTADVVQAYFDLGEADAELAIAREAIATRQETLALVKKRVETGFATELELRRAEAEVASAEAEAKDFEGQRAVFEHRLAILIGRMPSLHFAGEPPSAFGVPPEIPLGVPAALLERRPDIRAAEARVAGANARIGAAVAGYFPSLTIQGFAGYTSIDFQKIANPAGQLFAAGPVLRVPIFEGGRVRAQVLEARSRTDEATALYHATVLRAFGEVADAVVRIGADRGIRDDRTRQVEAARRAMLVARKQYDEGLALYLDVLESQRTLLAARQALVRTQRQLLADFVLLAKALGGGWTELPPDPFQKKLVESVTPKH